uniref:phytol kinase n=1 Tax=Magallana gigas TaxID=29159 RepID=A0A8W8KZ01_MAGGI
MNADITGGCSFCGQRPTDLLRCSRCKEVCYCSKDCQKGHWREGHREHCVAVNNQVLSMGENQGNICSFCGEEAPDSLKCGRCKEVYYCSKDCQREHWKEGHREQCKEEHAYHNRAIILPQLMLCVGSAA